MTGPEDRLRSTRSPIEIRLNGATRVNANLDSMVFLPSKMNVRNGSTKTAKCIRLAVSKKLHHFASLERTPRMSRTSSNSRSPPMKGTVLFSLASFKYLYPLN